MAIYHLSTKPISRSSGRSAVASAAYRAGEQITDDRLGKTYDYSKRSGVLYSAITTPNGLEIDRNTLWNLAEKTETRSNSRTAREIVINIPHELMQGDKSTGKMLALEFANNLSQQYGVAVDVAVHAPDKQGDNRNYHAHLLLTTRKLGQGQDGNIKLGDKSQLELSNSQLAKLGLPKAQDELVSLRKAWADLTNTYLAEHGLSERIDHRSHKDRGLLTLPTVKMGWQATELERNGIRTDVGDQNRAIKQYNEQVLIAQNLQKQKQIRDQKQKTHENARTSPTRGLQNSSARVVPPTTSDTPKNAPERKIEHFKLTPDEYRYRVDFLEKFHQKVKKIAQNILNKELLALREKAKPLLAAFEKLRDNKPLFFGKDQWEKDKGQALDRYNAIKEKHDTIKKRGVTDQHIKQANDSIGKHEPDLYNTAKAYTEDIIRHDHAVKQEHAERMGADTYAKPNEIYSGVIIKADRMGALQKTAKGIVYHALSNGLTTGKDYTIEYNKDASQVSYRENYDFSRLRKNREQDPDQNRGKGR